MSNLRLIIILLFSLNYISYGQINKEFIYQSDKNIGVSNLLIHNNEIYLNGAEYDSIPTRNNILVKLDLEGQILNAKSIGTISREGNINKGLFVDSNNNILSFGHTTHANDHPLIDNPFVFQFDENFTVVNKRSWGSTNVDEMLRSLVPTSDGGFLALGNYGWSPKGGMIIKLDSNFDIEWSQSYNNANVLLIFNSAKENADGSFIITGVHQINDQTSYLLTIKLSSNGAFINHNQYELDGRSAIVNSDHIGKTGSTSTLVVGTRDENNIANPVLITIDEDGTITEAKRMTAQSNFTITRLKVSNNGDYLCLGNLEISGVVKPVVIKFDENGVNQIHSFVDDNFNISISDIAENCNGNDCLYYVAINRSKETEKQHFQIFESELDCPNENNDLINFTSISYQTVPFDDMINYNISALPYQAEETSIDFEFQAIDRSLEIDLGGDTLICSGQAIEISSFNENADFYLWSTGEVSATILVNTPGDYMVSVSDHCERLFIDTISVIETPYEPLEVYFPNTFSPNGDSVNDCFAFYTSNEEVFEFNLSIFDRWGNLVFSTDSITDCWDGRFNNQKVNSDVYVYRYNLSYTGCQGEQLQKSGGGDVLIH